MSTEEAEEEKRLYQCLRKYQTILKQNARGSSSSSDPVSANYQTDNGEMFVQTITRFLHELKSSPTTDPTCSTSTHHRG
ncbi:hypothetical protein DITRI_Ditri06bG0061700 [Diplodiscus trichospermus]